MIAGDFNVIMCGEEIQGDSEPSLVGCNRFRLKSDNQPLLILTHPESSMERDRPFSFLASWLTHPEFRDVVLKCWSNDVKIGMNLENLTRLIQVRNRTVFGNIFARKRKGKMKLERMQKAWE
ncbi:hypothetical protein ES288_D04G100400v1 [Gossypium darwinii]|uniref:Endonuclease/exonuclease/phosphatase domain-containing protein n=1 Tax=Gossypium darwinii TaxID=34276 RepID=A0A5D2CVT8_GOSDA|nr:hypothetical protein ES288_D04G100400v1 [Gossypium darwinii]